MIDLSSFSYFNHVQVFDELPSTNEYAMNEIAAGRLNEGRIIVAKHQTKGKGRYGNQWLSSPNQDLLVTFIMRPNCDQTDVYKITIPFALATHYAINGFISNLHECKLKWPNDILINQKKVAGILAQFDSRTGLVVIGVGINVNSNWATTDDKISLSNLALNKLDVSDILFGLTESIEQQLLAILNCEINAKAWNDHALFINQRVIVMEGNTKLTGTFKGISESGHAIIHTEDQVMNVKHGSQFRLAV